jgi:hypothetical protein
MKTPRSLAGARRRQQKERRPAAQGKVVLKFVLLPTLVVLAILAAAYGLAAGAENSHGLLFVGLCAAFCAGDHSLWSRA